MEAYQYHDASERCEKASQSDSNGAQHRTAATKLPSSDPSAEKVETLAKVLTITSITSHLGIPDQDLRSCKAKYIRFGPLSGIFAMCLGLSSIVAALGILIGSDHEAVSSWPTPPSTYLAILTAIANLSMRYAAIQGVVIAWWNRAIRGTTLSRLHWDWTASTTLRGAITAGRRMGLLGLACIFSIVVVVDGPLLQRASTVIEHRASTNPVPLHVKMLPELPKAYTGIWVTAEEVGVSGEVFSYAFNNTIPTPSGTASNQIWSFSRLKKEGDIGKLWWNDLPLEGVIHGCPGRCRAKFRAPALFPTACESQQLPMDYKGRWNIRKSDTLQIAPPLNSCAFMIQINLVVDDSNHETINLITSHTTSTTHCEGTINLTTCSFRSGIGDYDVLIENNAIDMTRLGRPELVAIANNSGVNHTVNRIQGGHDSTLAGIVNLVDIRWAGGIWLYRPKDNQSEALDAITTSGAPIVIYQYGDVACPSYRNAHDDVVSSMNKLTMYLGAFATNSEFAIPSKLDADAQHKHSVIDGYPEGLQSVFHTNYWFFFAATLVEVVCVALVAPTYWGWWRLGRSVSFSPLELAKAFEAPMLSDCDSGTAGRALASDVGDIRVKYGPLSRSGSEKTRKAFVSVA